MDEFEKMILGFAFALIILIFGFTYYMLGRSAKGQPWPPVMSPCPDYWTYNSSNQTCYNRKNLGYPTTSTTTYDTTNATPCENYQNAIKYNLAWDGLTYGADPPANCSAQPTPLPSSS
jgi:hypothetical protein